MKWDELVEKIGIVNAVAFCHETVPDDVVKSLSPTQIVAVFDFLEEGSALRDRIPAILRGEKERSFLEWRTILKGMQRKHTLYTSIFAKAEETATSVDEVKRLLADIPKEDAEAPGRIVAKLMAVGANAHILVECLESLDNLIFVNTVTGSRDYHHRLRAAIMDTLRGQSAPARVWWKIRKHFNASEETFSDGVLYRDFAFQKIIEDPDVTFENLEEVLQTLAHDDKLRESVVVQMAKLSKSLHEIQTMLAYTSKLCAEAIAIITIKVHDAGFTLEGLCHANNKMEEGSPLDRIVVEEIRKNAQTPDDLSIILRESSRNDVQRFAIGRLRELIGPIQYDVGG